MGSFRSPILQEMLKRWRNAQRRPARRPGVYSDRISLDASNSPKNVKLFCKLIGFFFTFSMAEFRARSRLFHEIGLPVNEDSAPWDCGQGRVASNSAHQTGNCDHRNGTFDSQFALRKSRTHRVAHE